ncbi:MAG: hypothetical protein SFZ03_03425 [Candidatus Melainabacteria bacterium]|nr:hypothetical protein [Candidatus Melainabacteria bacterium]
MATATTENFPYTAKYVRELLKIEEHVLSAYLKALGVSPRMDDQSGGPVFSYAEVELLRRAVEMTAQGEDLAQVVQKLAPKKTTVTAAKTSEPAPMASKTSSALATLAPPHTGSQALVPTTASGSALGELGGTGALMATSTENLSMIVEAVSSAKENILKDLAKLLDDKLAGLDDVVVELIRTKSENDALRQKLSAALKEKEEIRYELSRFKPVQFGFYRKAGGK